MIVICFYGKQSVHNNILQVYKCHFPYNDIKAVKIVKMEPQYTETQEVRFQMLMGIKDVFLFSTCPVTRLFKTHLSYHNLSRIC